MSAQVVAARGDLEAGQTLRLELDAADGQLVPIALVHAEDGEFYAINDTCSHGAVSLAEGEVDGVTLECWLHGSTFDLRTGQPVCLPATRPVSIYPVTYEGDNVLVDVDHPVVPAPIV